MSAANTGGYWTGFRTPEATVGCCRAMGFELWCSELYRSQVENLNLSVRDFNVSNFCVTKLNVPNFSDAGQKRLFRIRRKKLLFTKESLESTPD